MKFPALPIALVLILMLTACEARANTETQAINITISQIYEIQITPSSASLVISTATAGSEPDDATVTATYSLSCNRTSMKITGTVSAAIPASTSLYATFAAPASYPGGTSTGEKQLTSTQAVDLVTGIGKGAKTSVNAQFRYHGTVDAGIINATTRTVTITLTNS